MYSTGIKLPLPLARTSHTAAKCTLMQIYSGCQFRFYINMELYQQSELLLCCCHDGAVTLRAFALPGPCDPECSDDGCEGPSPQQCVTCLHFFLKFKNNTRLAWLHSREYSSRMQWYSMCGCCCCSSIWITHIVNENNQLLFSATYLYIVPNS